MELRKEYADELKQLKVSMLKAQAFAAKLPVFAEAILKLKLTGDEEWLDFGNNYKKMYFAWGIKRGHFKSGTPRYVSNFDGEHDGFYFKIYVNCYSLFDEHQEFGLYEVTKGLDLFFVDRMNSTFYVTDENIESLLEVLNAWCISAFEQLKVYRAKKEIEKLEASLAKAKQQAGAA